MGMEGQEMKLQRPAMGSLVCYLEAFGHFQ